MSADGSDVTVPAHRLHDLQQQRSGQIRTQMDEHGQNHHGQSQSLLVILLQDSPAVPAPDPMHTQLRYTASLHTKTLTLTPHLSAIVVGCSSLKSSGAGTNMLTVLGADSRLVFVGPARVNIKHVGTLYIRAGGCMISHDSECMMMETDPCPRC